MDYPDSDEDGTERAAEMASGNVLLDADDMETTGDTEMEPAGTGSNTHSCTQDKGNGARGLGSRVNLPPHVGSCGSSLGERLAEDGPELPPIYFTVRKDREKMMVTRHLNGGSVDGTGSTVHGTTVSKVETIGNFANPGDRRHNHTMHRFDFRNNRNLSTSFDTSTLKCTTCIGEHVVLRREIEGGDVSYDTPSVFVLMDQNFPSMVPVGGVGTGTCMKIIQIEHGMLAELVSVFLEITKGFSIPAGTVVLLASASHMALSGTADYASDFVRASLRMRETLSGGVRVLHGVPILIGGTVNIPAIRTMAEINQWVLSTSELGNDITATRTLWDTLIRTREHITDCKITMRLPLSQHKLELGTFTSEGFSNLKEAAPLDEETEKSLITSLTYDLNELYSSDLCMEPIVDRYLDSEVFDDCRKQTVILIGASHLNRIADRIETEKWEVVNLCSPGFRITEGTVASLTKRIEELGRSMQLENCTAILQLFDNTVYKVGGRAECAICLPPTAVAFTTSTALFRLQTRLQ
jgi:hypothetical protein